MKLRAWPLPAGRGRVALRKEGRLTCTMIKKHPGPDKSGVLFCFLPQESENGTIFRVEFGGRQGTEQGQQGVLHCGSCFTLAFEFLFFLLEGG